MAGIVFRGLRKVFDGGTVAVDMLDLEIADGEFMVLVGPSGSGKSTVLRIAAGLDEASAGEVWIGDVMVNDDAPMDRQNHRALRLVLVVDEARRVLNYGQLSLIGLVRESRSKGASVFLISQSPDDFDTDEEDFLSQIGLTACFRSNSTCPKVLKACLGQTVDLAGLPDGVAVTRLPGQPGVTRIKAWE